MPKLIYSGKEKTEWFSMYDSALQFTNAIEHNRYVYMALTLKHASSGTCMLSVTLPSESCCMCCKCIQLINWLSSQSKSFMPKLQSGSVCGIEHAQKSTYWKARRAIYQSNLSHLFSPVFLMAMHIDGLWQLVNTFWLLQWLFEDGRWSVNLFWLPQAFLFLLPTTSPSFSSSLFCQISLPSFLSLPCPSSSASTI